MGVGGKGIDYKVARVAGAVLVTLGGQHTTEPTDAIARDWLMKATPIGQNQPKH